MDFLSITLRDDLRTITARVRRLDWEFVVASLAADPETIAELEHALTRFAGSVAECPWSEGPGLVGEPFVVLDLPARLVAVDDRLPCPNHSDYVELPRTDKSGRASMVVIEYELHPDWLLLPTLNEWQEVARERRVARQSQPLLDIRDVLYGQVADYLVRHWDDESIATADDPIARLHEQWLLTVRDDLRGASPREAMLSGYERIERDIESRVRQWTFLGSCPVPLLRTTHAFRFGSWGRHEIVVYYDLIRFLLGELQDLRSRSKTADLEATVSKLNAIRLEWLNIGQEEFGGRTPQEVIDDERQRIPPVANDSEACIDPDCPLCRMMADQSMGPAFWFLDGSHMDNDFAFSFFSSKAEWGYGEATDDDLDRDDDSDEEETVATSALPPRTFPLPNGPQIWQNSQMNEEMVADLKPGQKLTVLFFSIGGHLAELVENVRSDEDARPPVKELLTRFDNLRAAMRDRVSWLCHSLIQNCCEDLDTLASIRPKLSEKCCDLQRKFRWLDDIAESWKCEV